MPEPKEIGHQVRFPKGLKGLFQKACWEIPEIMGSSAMALIGIGLAVAGVMKYYQNDGDNREFKTVYTVLRSDDPKAKIVKNPVKTEYP